MSGRESCFSDAEFRLREIDAVIDRAAASTNQVGRFETETYGRQEGSAYNGHFGRTCYHPLFCFNNYGDLEGCPLREGNVHSAKDRKAVLDPIVARYIVFQMAEVAVSQELFIAILRRIGKLRLLAEASE
jgi:Transposase DDE domain group 1